MTSPAAARARPRPCLQTARTCKPIRLVLLAVLVLQAAAVWAKEIGFDEIPPHVLVPKPASLVGPLDCWSAYDMGDNKAFDELVVVTPGQQGDILELKTGYDTLSGLQSEQNSSAWGWNSVASDVTIQLEI